MKPIRTALAAFALLLVPFSAGCAAAAPGAWKVHRDPHGFAVAIPSGWTVAFNRHNLAARMSGGGISVTIRPAFARQEVNAAQAQAVANALARTTAPALAWDDGRLSGRVVRLNGSSRSRAGVAFLAWRTSPEGTVFYLYEADAPQPALRSQAPLIARVFQSFRITPARGTAATRPGSARLSYRTYREPSEGSFTVALPRGWRVQLGLNRQSFYDIRPAFAASSPDGAFVAGGDPQLPYFTVPTAYLRMAGIGVGQWYSPGQGVRLMVRPFERGVQFAREYVQAHFGRCGGFRIVRERNLDPYMNSINAAYHQYGLPVTISSGDVAFTCSQNGRAMSGYLFAGTQLAQAPTSAIWNVQYLFGFVAPAARTHEAVQALNEATRTYRVDPGWSRRNGASMVAASRAMSQAEDQVSSIIMDHSSPIDAIDSYDEKAVRGEQTVYDPQTGESYQIDDRYEYNFVDHNGNIAGSDTSALPDVNFRQLLPQP